MILFKYGCDLNNIVEIMLLSVFGDVLEVCVDIVK